jgi:hypothetical protein
VDVGKIDEEREQLLEELTDIIHSLLEELCRSQPRCSFQCDSMLLGAAIQQLHLHHLIWPKPSRPFTSINFAEIAKIIRSLDSPVWCDTIKASSLTSSENEGLQFGRKKKKRAKQNTWRIEEEESDVKELACHQHACTLQGVLTPKINDLEHRVRGLDLDKIINL